ncbi:KRRI-Interacting protein 1, partial [Cichlidogyrus casuarinus]
AFPRQTYWWVGCKLFEPNQQALEIGQYHTFRLYAPKCSAVAVVINGHEWHHLRPVSGRIGRWAGKVNVGEKLGDLSVYGRMGSGGRNSNSSGGDSVNSTLSSSHDGSRKIATHKIHRNEQQTGKWEEDIAYVKLLDYVLVYKGNSG